MSRRPVALLIPVLLLASGALALGHGSSARANAPAESGSPINDQGSNFDYRSNITAITPQIPGLSLQVLEFADRLLLTNHSGRTVTIFGYSGEPYARVLANGTAEQNVRSPATYLNTNFYADVVVPATANPNAPPKWEVVDRTGQFEWHDHRIHWMSPTIPPEVKNRAKRTLIFNWQVPIEVGARKGAVSGQLFWTPENAKASVAVIVLGALIVVFGLLFVLFVRRRRARAAPSGGGGVVPETVGDRRAKRGDGVIAFPDMAPLACLMHWYVSMLYVVPVLAVGGWGWWSAKRSSKRKDPPATRPA